VIGERFVHAFVPRWDTGATSDLPDIGNYHFRSALDVIDYCEQDSTSTWRSWPLLWHLDDTGAFVCYSKGSSFDSVRTFAQRPAGLLRCRGFDVDDSCPNRWVIVESRHPYDEERYRVDEGDAAAFVKLRRGLARRGVTLLDVVILNQDLQWWSLNELTTGTTTWPSPRARPAARRPR
jgi:hypothetical protein